ncbi:MBL fold metallo-hydrolase [Gemmatimonadota bacterium]
MSRSGITNQPITDRPMRRTLPITMMIIFSLMGGVLPIRGQAQTLERQQVSDHVWMLSGRGGNVAVVVTGDGAIVIDTQYSDSAPVIVELVRAITDQPILYTINTHVHGDHVGGNAILQEHGDIIAHRNTWERMKESGADEGALPRIVFDGEMVLRPGGIEMHLLYGGRAHTDTDVAVWLPGENVLITGDLFFNRMTPYVDKGRGSHTAGWISVINSLLQLGDADTKVVPGHGELSDLNGFREMSRYLQAVRATVLRAHEAGRSKEEIMALTLADLGDPFTEWEGNRIGMALAAAYTELIGNGPTLLVVNKSENTLAFVDVETNDVRGKVTTGPGPHEVAVSPDSRLAYVTNYASGRPVGTRCWLTVVDTESMRAIRDIELKDPVSGEYLSAPHGIMVTADGTAMWVTVEGSGAVARITLPDEEVAAVYRTEQRISHQVVPLPDGSKAYIANIGGGSVSVVNVSTGMVKTIPCRPGTEGIDVSPDGSQIWATNRSDGTISIIDTHIDEVVDTVHSGNFPIRVKFTPDGTHALVSNARDGEVVLFDVRSREIERTISTGAMPIGLLILPDGSKAYAANTASNMVSVLDLIGWQVTGTIHTGLEPDGLALVIKR